MAVERMTSLVALGHGDMPLVGLTESYTTPARPPLAVRAAIDTAPAALRQPRGHIMLQVA